jgi:hypothetical protein
MNFQDPILLATTSAKRPQILKYQNVFDANFFNNIVCVFAKGLLIFKTPFVW